MDDSPVYNLAFAPYDELEMRSTLQSVAENIINGGTIIQLARMSYNDRLNDAFRKLKKAMIGVIGEEKYLALESALCCYTGMTNNIFFTMGMQAGAKLHSQLLGDSTKDY